MGILDVLTGGKSDSAMDALRRAEQYYTNVKLPTLNELTLPKLQEYVEAGVMTPEEARSYLQDQNAFEDQNIDQTGTGAQTQALSRLSEIANAGPDGTPMQQAQMENTLSRMNANVAGQRGAIEQSMAAKGTPYALIQAALSNQTVGQEAQQAHLDAVNGQAAAYQAALNAMSQQGALGGQLQGQMNSQANNVAQAANAMQQFNAQNQQQNAQFNAGNRQSANVMNAANRQQVSNNNTGLTNQRTAYNAQLPQQMFGNSMAKAQGQAGAATNAANLYNQQGQQTAGANAGLLNLASSFIPMPGGAAAKAGAAGAQGASNPTTQLMNQSYQQGWYAHGGVVKDGVPPPISSTRGVRDDEYLNCAEGDIIPGDAPFPGDSYANDTVPIMASPGEAIIPRSQVEENPDVVESLIDGEADVIDERDVATLLKAMRAIRMGVA